MSKKAESRKRKAETGKPAVDTCTLKDIFPQVFYDLQDHARITQQIEFPEGGMVTLTFRAGTEEARRALKADSLCCALWHLQEYLRRVLNSETTKAAERRVVAEIIKSFNATLESNGVRLEELWT